MLNRTACLIACLMGVAAPFVAQSQSSLVHIGDTDTHPLNNDDAPVRGAASPDLITLDRTNP